VNRNELRRIRDHMTNRGPDGKGEWYSQNGRAVPAGSLVWINDLGPSEPEQYFLIGKVFSDAAENPFEGTEQEAQGLFPVPTLERVNERFDRV